MPDVERRGRLPPLGNIQVRGKAMFFYQALLMVGMNVRNFEGSSDVYKRMRFKEATH